MAGQAKQNELKIPAGKTLVDEAEYNQLVQDNEENKAVIGQMIEKLDQLAKAQLSGTGMDPAITARALLPDVPVQFLGNYTRAARASKIQKGANIVPYAAVEAGDIVLTKPDEVERLEETFPGLIESDPEKFSPKVIKGWRREFDDNGRPRWVSSDREIPVEDLLKRAQNIG